MQLAEKLDWKGFKKMFLAIFVFFEDSCLLGYYGVSHK
jgi:hypothetical protein